jgi:hypothetical protein
MVFVSMVDGSLEVNDFEVNFENVIELFNVLLMVDLVEVEVVMQFV